MARLQLTRWIGISVVLLLWLVAPAAPAQAAEPTPGLMPADELRPVAVPAPSADAVRFHESGNWIWEARLWALAVQAILLFSGLSAWLRTRAQRIGRVWILTIGVYSVVYTALVFVLDLPLAYYAGFVRQHAYGLSNQSLERWLGNELKELAVGMIGAFLFLWVPFWLMARSPKRWWLYTTLLALPFSFLVMRIAPIWIDPLFNEFAPMKDQALEQKILAQAERAGISGSHIYEVNKSVDTRALNAYVKGFLDTKRIVLYDTLIAQLDEREVLAVLGHEMGHYVLGHVTRSLLLASLGVLACLFFVDRAGSWLARRWAPRFGFDKISDVASIPLLALLLQLSTLGLSPVILAYSRFQEHEADTFALELTRTNHSAASAFAKLQQENLSVPWHTRFETLWRSTHPSIGERIEYCNRYHPWTEGGPLVYGAFFRH